MADNLDSRSENVVDYQVYDIRRFSNDNTEPFDIQTTLYDILSYSQSLIGDYIWQNDSFNLRTHDDDQANDVDGDDHDDDGENIPYLQGSTDFGDNIEDEWFIVYILSNISLKFSSVVIKVNDNDGEFLLIEAADYLPKWLEPDTSENRVFFYQGNLHIIPLPKTPSEITVFPVGKPSVCQALKVLWCNPAKTIASPWIEDRVMRKVKEYPDKIQTSFHHVLCYLPDPLKYLLERKPSLIAPAVLAFVNCDPFQGHVTGQKIKHFSFESLVPHRVCFTKCLYAQLVKQNFIPNKSVMKMLPDVSSKSYKGHILGLQITYGFEILYSQECMTNEGAQGTTSPAGHQWQKYLDALQHHGYFKNEVVGSKLYCQLLSKAKEYFSRNCLNEKDNYDIVSEIKDLLQDMPARISSSTVSNGIPPDDDENWLEVSPNELESLLSQYGLQSSCGDIDLNNVVHGMNSFVEKVSGYEGAELPSEPSDDDEIQFNPDDFVQSMDCLFRKPAKYFNERGSSEDETSDDDTDEDERYDEYANSMDRELSATNIGKSFVKINDSNDDVKDDKTELPNVNDKDDITPVDIDLNLVQNFLESYSLQEGMPGPVSNILNSMGILLPQTSTESD